MDEKHAGGRPRVYGGPRTIRLTIELQEALNGLAKRERRTFADMLRLVLEKGLEEYGVDVHPTS